jgi:hypothetical protein
VAELKLRQDAPPTPLDVVRLRRALRSRPMPAAVEPSLELMAAGRDLSVDELLVWGATSGEPVLLELLEARHE